MKSMLQEASSIAKAVDKAWQEAGKPAEFTLKILQESQRNFFGLLKKPAIVSIIYDPRKLPNALKKESRSGQKRRGQQESRAQKGQKKAPAREPRAPRNARVPKDQPRVSSEERIVWTDNYLEMVGDWLRVLLQKMAISTKFGMSLDRGLLKIQFDAPVIESVDNERILFASLVALLLQFLRRHEKKKLRGLRLAITSRRS